METLFSNIKDHAHKPAIVDKQGKQYTYRDILDLSNEQAKKLGKNRGVLVLSCENDVEPITMFIGACLAHNPVVLIGPAESQRTDICERFAPNHQFYRNDRGEWILDTLNDDDKFVLHPELAVLLSTSGSTGNAKLVRLSHKNVASNAESISQYLNITAKDRAITTLPFHYSFGMSILTSHFFVGATVLLNDVSVVDTGFFDVLNDKEATTFSGVPRTFELLDKTEFFTRNFKTLNKITQAGGRLDPHLVKKFAAWGEKNNIQFYVMYGQTEASPRISYLPPGLAVENPDCIGLPVPGGEINIIDSNGNLISEFNREGELQYKGPNVMMGYAQCRDDFFKGYEYEALKTGDMAIRKANGLFKIVGRASRFVKISGVRIGLDNVEQLLAKSGIHSAVTGTDEGIVAAVIESEKSAGAIAEQLVATLQIPSSSLKVLEYKEFPTLSNGKTDYKKILSSISFQDANEDIDLKAGLAHILGVGTLEDNDTFISAGGDSLNFFQAAVLVERFHNRPIPGWEVIPLCELSLKNNPKFSCGQRDILIISRSIAVWLMMISHVFIELSLWRHLPDAARLLTKASTTCFLIVFGFGLARTWSGKINFTSMLSSTNKLLPKIGLLYLAIVIVQAGFLIRNIDFVYFLKVITFNDYGRFVQVLMIYMLFLMLTPLLVPLLDRARFFLLSVLFSMPYVIHTFIVVPHTPFFLLDMIVGASSFRGPSLMLTFPLILFGYALNQSSKDNNLGLWVKFASIISIFYLSADCILSLKSGASSPFSYGVALDRGDAAYYAFGIFSFIIIHLVSSYLSHKTLDAPIWSYIFSPGYAPLQVYVVGNFLLNLGVGRFVYSFPISIKFLLAAAFIAALAVIGTHLPKLASLSRLFPTSVKTDPSHFRMAKMGSTWSH